MVSHDRSLAGLVNQAQVGLGDHDQSRSIDKKVDASIKKLVCAPIDRRYIINQLRSMIIEREREKLVSLNIVTFLTRRFMQSLKTHKRRSKKIYKSELKNTQV